ncbi:dicarboxylate/amino acid:cation symporter [Chlamydia trachomatis]|jgi:Na+/H+-dicarboxylate symporters|uniref:Sodium:dicarboxylate symporter n=2 Tax=Chlamydia muridarum TaxID=83560 RepID=A0A069ZYM1_CHLMR|nr:dicarboxylate/amino acid:cation symporter [Chlamydia muridarum]UFT35835.1 dicarboxylate/amino acid:cation symporter [Chlamydia trachomatis]AAF73590.1 sodium:dicarboxylate symporter family protein [Chlamydia muridarum str. Nigg]AHH23067.1 sodium:dicarboxylate symporter [Chlamydia muridarum str. Nigg3 CMUT3-5]AHH23992.1 sodium:dicarboxylate symporter [Chlamydia muridarum str. Nigg CM972]AID38199.1 sodium:dicarboxylate symporter [Chlamydia muridarum str. Nigg 2 MCR]
MKLWMKIFIGLIIGVVSGLVLEDKAVFVKPFGDIFLNLLSMVVYPLVFCSMVLGIASISDMKKLGRIGLRSLGLYLGTTAVAIGIGLAFALFFCPGRGCDLQGFNGIDFSAGQPSEINFLTAFAQVFPSNPMRSFVEGNILQIIIFALFTGIALRLAGEVARPVEQVIHGCNEIMLRMVNMIMSFAPYGVAASMAWISGNHGLTVLLQLGKFLVVYYIACICHAVLVFGGLVRLGCRRSFSGFLSSMMDAISCAVSTASSSATLPVTMRCVSKNLGVSSEISGFVLPLGATVNMNGTAIFQGMAAVFIAQAYNCPLSLTSLLLLVVTATFSAVGSAGVPGGGMITLGSVLASVGLPIQGIAVLAGIDRLRDIIGTPMNILGDSVVALYVANGEGELASPEEEEALPQNG